MAVKHDPRFFQVFKAATHLNGGRPVLQKQRPRVEFDPKNPTHLDEAERVLRGGASALDFSIPPAYTDMVTMLTRTIAYHHLANRHKYHGYHQAQLEGQATQVTPFVPSNAPTLV